ncbi:hypothetical protein, partial [Paraburkholderia rhynchosiae]|uniref:hypothetical protein n=1 Tax=Paraburkholderia rhynchosiae TaxID=487049 RepID=UPI001ABF65F5
EGLLAKVDPNERRVVHDHLPLQSPSQLSASGEVGRTISLVVNYEASTSSGRALAGDNFPSFYA